MVPAHVQPGSGGPGGGRMGQDCGRRCLRAIGPARPVSWIALAMAAALLVSPYADAASPSRDQAADAQKASRNAYRIPYTVILAAAVDSLPEGTATIPFELLEGLLLVQARAFGTDADTTGVFALDTGAGYLALDHDLAAAIGLIDHGDAAGAVGLTRDPLRRLVIGSQSMDQVQPVLTIDGAIIRRVTDRPVLGLLGSKLYEDRALQVDYVARTLRLIPTTAAAADSARSAADSSQSPVPASPSDASAAIDRSRRMLASAVGARAVAVPFSLAGDGKILLRAKLGVSRFASSRPLTLILDTGATKTVLFRPALQSLGIEFEKWKSLCGLSVPTLFGAPSACLVRMPRVNVDAFACEYAGAGKSTAGPAPTASGADAAGTKPAGGSGAEPPRRMRPGVQAMLGEPKQPADSAPRDGTGAGAADSARAAAAAGSGMASAAPAGPAITLEPTTLRAEDLDAIVMESELQEVLSQVVGTPVHGLLGYTFLRHYRLTIDYPQRVLWLEAAADPDPRPFEYSHPGIQIERDGASLRLVAVAEGSPAAREKVAVGDTLVSVDGRDVSAHDLAEVARWLEGEPGSRVTLVLANSAGRRTVAITRRRLL